MPRTRVTEEPMIRMLQEAERRGNVRDICRQPNMAEQTLERWRRQVGGMDVAAAKRLRALERENAVLKRRVGDLPLDHRMLQDVLGNTWYVWLPSARAPPSWSRPTGSARDEPARCWCGSAAARGGSQARRSGRP